MTNCELCDFNNPKGCVTAIIIRNGKLLLIRRNENPHKGKWDLPGGYMEASEKPEEAMHRELREELGVHSRLTFADSFPGEAAWKKKKFAILNHVFLADIGNKNIKLDKENGAYKFVPLKELNPRFIAFDSNRNIIRFVKEKFGDFEMTDVKKLVEQLDPSASVNEQTLYKAMLNGHVARVKHRGRLVGMGWVFVRQTLLRKQGIIEDMIVDKKYRGRGIGKTILQKLIQWARKEGIEVLELTTNARRIAANKLYQSRGFILHPTNHYLFKL